MSTDEKYAESDDEYCDADTIVHDTDGRKSVYDSVIAGKPIGKLIIKCIVQLVMNYQYKDYSLTSYGTGTVYKVDQHKNAYVLTCAHNIRHKIKECIDCGRWMQIINETCTCNSNNLREKIIKANRIQCNRRNIESDQWIEEFEEKKAQLYTYGTMEHPGPYVATCFYINEEKYETYPTTNGGYDIAILSFVDSKDFYAQYCKHIEIENIIHGKKTLENIASFFMFGYPHYIKYPEKNENGKMKGMQSIGRDWQVKQHKTTGQWYLKQWVIDASAGQSGSALFYINQTIKRAVIFAVHTGGKESKRFNIAPFINQDILQQIAYCSKTRKVLDECEQQLKTVAANLKIRKHKLNELQSKCVENIKKTFDDLMFEETKKECAEDLNQNVVEENEQNAQIIAPHESNAKYQSTIRSLYRIIGVLLILLVAIIYQQIFKYPENINIKPIALNIHSHLGHFLDYDEFRPENMLVADESVYCSLDNIKDSDRDWIVLSMSDANILYNPTTIQLRVHEDNWNNRKFILNIGSIKTNQWIQIYQNNKVRNTNDTQKFDISIDDEKWQTIQQQGYRQFKTEIMQSTMENTEKSAHSKHCITELKIFGVEV